MRRGQRECDEGRDGTAERSTAWGESTPLADLLQPHTTARSRWLRACCLAGAGVFFLLGLLGWLIPLVTGIPFYVVALLLLGAASDRARRWINKTERRLPDDWRLALRRALAKVRGRRPGRDR